MWGTLCCLLGLMALGLRHWAEADSDFCDRPANMDLCWWRNNLYKRYLRFGRGDPYLRFGRGDPYLRFGRGDPYLRFGRGGDPYLRFGRGGDPYLRFGRGGDPYLRFGRGGDPFIRFGRAGDPYLRFGRGEPYLRFGRGEPYLRFGRGDPYLRFGRGGDPFIRFGRAGDPYLRFGRGEPYLRFGRGDPFLRFGRAQQPESWRFNPFNTFGKRDADSDSLEKYIENGGYLRFGRSESQSAQTPLQTPSEDSSALRKKRDVNEASFSSQEVHRTARDVKDGGFLRFGRDKVLDTPDVGASSPPAEEVPAKAATPADYDPRETDPTDNEEYLRFDGRTLGFGKRNYLRFGRAGPEAYLRFGKRSEETA